jgi:hypothetical protein
MSWSRSIMRRWMLPTSNMCLRPLDVHRPQLVLNASAFNDVDGAESRAGEAYAVNALGPRNIAVAPAASGLALLLYQPTTSSMASRTGLTTNSIEPIRYRFMARAS